MLVGIMSDSHGRHLAVREAMRLFQERGVEHVIHCGDVGRGEVFDELLGIPLGFVWGNTDLPDGRLLAYLDGLGIEAPSSVPLRLVCGGKSFAVFHGHEVSFRQAIKTPSFDYICHGHTHEARDERIDGKRIINPGALHRVRVRTVATLDTKTDQLEFHEIRAT